MLSRFLFVRIGSLITGFFLLATCSQLSGNGLRQIDISIAGQSLRVEVAATAKDRNRGLMFRESLPENQGMLFVWPQAEYRNFWMKNTRIPLDIAFFDDQGFLINTHAMQPDPQTGEYADYPSAEPARYAVEVNQGWLANHSIRKFDQLILPEAISSEK
ncbi:MAG: DUF192 domain-containing protein [Leptospiraceae bacterium]|nr:DUF192 domain-containing protein [Leptospiraceae bacterium]